MQYTAAIFGQRNQMKEGEKVRKIYRCKRCERQGRPNAIRVIEYTVGKYNNLWNPENPQHYIEQDYGCPNCGRETSSQMIEGRYVADQKCGAKCVNAIGPHCECSCGGKNHGRHYTYHIERTEDATEQQVGFSFA